MPRSDRETRKNPGHGFAAFAIWLIQFLPPGEFNMDYVTSASSKISVRALFRTPFLFLNALRAVRAFIRGPGNSSRVPLVGAFAIAALISFCQIPVARDSEPANGPGADSRQDSSESRESSEQNSRNDSSLEADESEQSDSSIKEESTRDKWKPETPETEWEAKNLHPPLDEPIVLTGTTGEYRRSHFHYGIDLSSDIGDPVYSVRQGYVSRILYDGYGLGYGIWVRHADGRESKYGHLSEFAPAIVEQIQSIQPEITEWLTLRKRFDLRFSPGQIPVKRGEQIALSGDTGSGPSHLHFEYLEGDLILNPLKHGLSLEDGRAPVVESLILIPCESGATVNGKDAPLILPVTEKSDCGDQSQACSSRKYEGKESVTVQGKTCLQVRYFDPSGKYARLGISSLRMSQDRRDIYSSSFLTLIHSGSFRHLMLYSESSRIGGGTQYIHNAFDLLPGQYSFLRSIDHGRLSPPDAGQSSRVTVELLDAAGNKSLVELELKGAVSPMALRQIANSDMGWAPYSMDERLKDAMNSSAGVGRPGKDLTLISPDEKLKLHVGPHSLTGAVRFEISQNEEAPATGKLKRMSSVYIVRARNLDELTGMIFRDRIFVLDPVRITVEGLEDNDGLYRITDSGALYPVAYSRNGMLTGYIRTLEKYVVLKDLSPPVIRSIPTLRTRSGKPLLLSLRYFADYGTGVNVSSLKLEVNGKPALAEWNPDRYGYEIFYPEEILKPGRYNATIQVMDYAGNSSSRRSFVFVVD